MVNLYSKRYYCFILSALIFLAGIVAYFVNDGFNLDIQFQGGTVIELKAAADTFKDKNEDEVKNKIADTVKAAINKNVMVQRLQQIDAGDTKEQYDVIKISIGSENTLSNTDIGKVKDSVIKEFKLDEKNAVISEESVEPLIGKEISENGVKAVLVASLLIILYVAFRFKSIGGFSAGVMAVIGLLHDVLVMVAVYVIFRIPVNESFIAAILTVYGYSMNDTVIIYDRVRENTRLLRKVPLPELVNTSILQTLSRSINTAVTVLISIVTVFIFAKVNGIGSVEEFAFPLTIGIASGCYSSIFIASPLWVMWKESQKKKKKTSKAVNA